MKLLLMDFVQLQGLFFVFCFWKKVFSLESYSVCVVMIYTLKKCSICNLKVFSLALARVAQLVGHPMH